MPVQTNIDALSTTASSNSPAGSESAALVDDYLRQISAHIAVLRDRIAAAGTGGADMTAVNAAIAAAFVTHNTASDPHPGYTTSAELATALAGVTAGAPTQVAFSTTWDATASKIINAPYTVTGALAMVGTQTGSVPGGFTSGVFVANGANIPTFNGTAATAWNNTNGARNTVTWTEEVEGIHYWYVNGSRLYAPASGNAVEEVAPATGGAGTTYTLSKSGDTLTLTPSTGAAQNVDLSGYVDATELTAALNTKLSIATAAAYSTTWDTSDINGKWLPSQAPGANFALTESTSGSVAGGGTACWFTPTANITATIGGVAYSWTAGTSYSVLLLKHRSDEVARWSVSGGGGAAAVATAITLTGPTTSTVGAASAAYTVAANGSLSGSVTVTPTAVAGLTFSPTSVTLSAGSPTATFTVTASSAGSRSVAVTNGSGLTNPASITLVSSVAAATAVTLTGPATSTAGAASTNYTVGANGTITGTVVVTPTAVAGVTFTPTSVSISSGTPTGTFTATVAAASTVSVAVTNNGGLTNPSAISLTASAAVTPGFIRFGSLPADTAESGTGPYTYTVTTAGGYQRRDLIAENLRMPASAVSSFIARMFVTTPGPSDVNPFIQLSLVTSDTTTAPSVPYSDSTGLLAQVNRGNGSTPLISSVGGSTSDTYVRFSRAIDGVVTISHSPNGSTGWVDFGTIASTAGSPLWPRVDMFSNAAGHVIGVEFVSHTGMEAS